MIPQALEFLDSSDADFETSSSSKTKTLMLFHRDKIVTNSIGFVFHNGVYEETIDQHNNKIFKDKFGIVAPCHKVLMSALKLD